MRRAALAGGILAMLALTAVAEANPRFVVSHRPGAYHHPVFGHGHPHHSHVFVGGSVFWDPFFFPAFYPYYLPYPYPYPYPAYPYPPPEEAAPGAPPGEAPQEEEAPPPEDARNATYGLIQLRGVPDGAAVDLDDRFWLTAERLEERWLAVPRGKHTLTVHVRGSEPIVRQIDVSAGKNQVVRFGSSPRRSG